METGSEGHAGYAERILDGTSAGGALPTYCIVQDILLAKVKSIFRLDRKSITPHRLDTFSYSRVLAYLRTD
jgi:hypothetical protein